MLDLWEEETMTFTMNIVVKMYRLYKLTAWRKVTYSNWGRGEA